MVLAFLSCTISDAGTENSPIREKMTKYTTRFVDDDYQVVCYEFISGSGYGKIGGISCVRKY